MSLLIIAVNSGNKLDRLAVIIFCQMPVPPKFNYFGSGYVNYYRQVINNDNRADHALRICVLIF